MIFVQTILFWKQDKAMIGSPEKSMTKKQKLKEQVSNAIF